MQCTVHTVLSSEALDGGGGGGQSPVGQTRCGSRRQWEMWEVWQTAYLVYLIFHSHLCILFNCIYTFHHHCYVNTGHHILFTDNK